MRGGVVVVVMMMPMVTYEFEKKKKKKERKTKNQKQTPFFVLDGAKIDVMIDVQKGGES